MPHNPEPFGENGAPNLCGSEHKKTAAVAEGKAVDGAIAAATRDRMAPKSQHSVPEHVYDKNAKVFYTLGRVLGEGGFARCYEVTSDATGQSFAAKVVPKDSLTKPKQKHKLLQEIKIHQTLKHDHIVRLYRVFEDEHFVYIIMELCEGQTMMEELKVKGRLGDDEARIILLQLLAAVEHLHANRVIHRDLKLGNLFLKTGPTVKLGDFGLATLVYGEDDRKRTICGTPNYIAPEILDGGERGHSYEVDIWSFGVIMYTMLVGQPPFQRQHVKEIYEQIRGAKYEFPAKVSICPEARDIITRLLHPDPGSRPGIADIRSHGYFSKRMLPLTPRRELVPPTPRQGASSAAESGLIRSIQSRLKGLLCNYSPDEQRTARVDAPPFVYLMKWMDFSSKYGIGYLLSNGSTGFYFNDGTSVVLSAGKSRGHYFQPDSTNRLLLVRESFLMASPKEMVRSKLEIMQKFDGFLQAKPQTSSSTLSDALPGGELIFMVKYFRTAQATFFRLSNRVLQVNFFDHCKLVIGDEGATLVFLDADKRCLCFSNDTSRTQLPSGVAAKLQYVYDLFVGMMTTATATESFKK